MVGIVLIVTSVLYNIRIFCSFVKPIMDQIVLFGDSITQHSSSQDAGFAFKAAVENGTLLLTGSGVDV